MNDLTEHRTQDIANLDVLASQARIYAESAAGNMLQLGRVLLEAKEIVPHGGFKGWVEQNVGVSMRWAEICMGGYTRYGDNPDYAALGTSKLQIMLALPEGMQDEFMQDNDVQDMTAREVREAVRKARAEAKAEADAEIEKERKARRAAEARAEQLAARPEEIPDEIVDDLRRKGQEIERLGAQAKEALTIANELRRENAGLRQDIKDQEMLLEQTQSLYDQAQADLLDAKSELARGDADRAPSEELTAEVFQRAVNAFVGTCCRMPQMRRAFSAMPPAERSAYETALETVENWAAGARAALESYALEAIVID